MEFKIKRDGLQLNAILECPAKERCPLVILFHGFTGNAGYKPERWNWQMAQRLKAEGIASLRFDFNGHGKSEGAFEDMTVLNELCDAIAVLEYARKLSFVTHIYLVGHSQGGVVASMLAGYYPDMVSGLVALAAAAVLREDAIRGQLMGNIYDPQHVPDTVALTSDGPLKVGGAYLRTAQLLPIFETAGNYSGPACVIHGTADTVVPPRIAQRLHYVLKNSELHLVEGENHELQNHTQQVIDLTVSFLLRQETTH